MSKTTLERIRSKLTLDKENAWLAGVCAGIARYFNTDPALVRVITLVTALFLTKPVIAAYLIAWFIMDEG